MIVVSDSSPINFLVRLGCHEVLPKMFAVVVIPSAVRDELTRPTTPTIVREFVQHAPQWLEVHEPARVERIPKLQSGESAAISLALEMRAGLLLVDERDARAAAVHRGLSVIGLLGILERAATSKLIDLPSVIASLPHDYRIDRRLIDEALARHRDRSKPE